MKSLLLWRIRCLHLVSAVTWSLFSPPGSQQNRMNLGYHFLLDLMQFFWWFSKILCVARIRFLECLLISFCSISLISCADVQLLWLQHKLTFRDVYKTAGLRLIISQRVQKTTKHSHFLRRKRSEHGARWRILTVLVSKQSVLKLRTDLSCSRASGLMLEGKFFTSPHSVSSNTLIPASAPWLYA